MSLAVLARKTRAKQKLKKRGKFILNMTGRGNVLGMNAKMSRGNCKGLTTCAGKRAACCVGVGGSQCCEFPHGGQPAPQQGYRVYLNRKSKGAYRPAGGKQCKTLSGCTSAKSVWKQGSNLDAGEITRKRRDNTLACYTDVYTAPTDCNKICCCDCKNICGCRATDLVRYTRINKSFGCQTTKAVRMGRTASEQIARRRAAVDCIAPKHRTIFLNLTGLPGPASLTFDGCCGKQCLILGQQYTFTITSTFTTSVSLEIQWCAGLVQNITVPGSSTGSTTTSFSFTVPKFNKNCQPATEAVITSSTTSLTPLRISYCKKAFKTPQMLGSCSGR